MSNNISFTGHVAKDGELSLTANDNNVLEFSVGNNVGFGDKQETNWFRCKIWGERALKMHPHIIKGKEVFVTGQLTLREYDKKDGGGKGYSADVRVSEISFCGKKDA